MKNITRDIPTTLIPPGTGTIATRLTIPTINPLSKENTGIILPDGASTMNVSSVKIIGTEGIDHPLFSFMPGQYIARYGIGMGLVVNPHSTYKRGPARHRQGRLIAFDPLP
jgi:hypothetical protein